MSSLPWIVVLCLNLSLGLEKLGPCTSLNGSVFVNEKCLKAFNIPLPWSEARDFCSNNLYSGKLAELVTLEERQVAINIVKKFGQAVWLGASDTNTEGTFVWTESNVSLSRTDDWWSQKQPDDEKGREDCVELFRSPYLELNDALCTNERPPLCEIALISRNVASDPCYPWKNALFRDGTCLTMFTSPLSWNNSKSFCRDMSEFDLNFDLTELFTEEQKARARSVGTEMNVSSYWTGGRADPNAGRLSFVWDTTPDQSIPTNLWEDGQPNYQSGIQDCVCMMTSGLLNDKECNKSRAFVCEKNECNVTDWTSNKTCFSINFTKKNMSTAQNWCRSSGGKLAELTTGEKFQALSNWLKGNATEYFIGGDYLDGTFVWNVSRIPIRLNWWRDKGNDSQSGECVAMDSTAGKLDDTPCDIKKPFVCQGEGRNPCDTILPGTIYASGNCFKYYDMNMTWQAAQAYCLREGSHLAEPTTAEMDGNITMYIAKLRNGTSATATLFWIGGTYTKKSDSFSWATNGDLISSTNLNTLIGGEEKENLAWHNLGLNFQWENRPGDELHGFVCQTAAVFDDIQKYVAVFPKMLHGGASEGYLQVTAGYSFVVYITFDVYIDGVAKNRTIIPLAPRRDVQFDLDQLLTLPYAGVSSSYVLIQSNQPVTVTLYITDASMNQSSSTLIFPVSIYKALEADLAHVLFSVFKEQPDNMVSVVAMSSLETDVLVVNNNQDVLNPSFAIGRVHFTNLISVEATLKSAYDVMTSSMRVNLDGAYLNASQPVAVFIGSLGDTLDGATPHDSTMDQILPLLYVGNEYFVFPSDSTFSQTADIIKCVAVHDWTSIDIFKDSGNEPLVMKSAGDVVEVPFYSQSFLYVRGNASFYVFKINSKKSGSSQLSCMSSILPSNVWRHQYDLVVNPMLRSFIVIIYLVVETSLTDFVEINNTQKPSSLTCTEIQGSSYSGCHYLIDSSTQSYYHIGLGNKHKFGAYLYASNTRSALCHPLGVTDTLEPSTVANYTDLKVYLEKLYRAQVPVPQTTCGLDLTTPDNDAVTSQVTQHDAYPSNENNLNATQTRESTTPQNYDLTAADVTAEYNNPDRSTDDVISVSGPTYSAEMTRQSQLGTVEHLISEISKTLHIDAQNTSSYRRTKISVPDRRASATVTGTFGIAIMLGVFSLICFGDMRYFFRFCISILIK